MRSTPCSGGTSASTISRCSCVPGTSRTSSTCRRNGKAIETSKCSTCFRRPGQDSSAAPARSWLASIAHAEPCSRSRHSSSRSRCRAATQAACAAGCVSGRAGSCSSSSSCCSKHEWSDEPSESVSVTAMVVAVATAAATAAADSAASAAVEIAVPERLDVADEERGAETSPPMVPAGRGAKKAQGRFTEASRHVRRWHP